MATKKRITAAQILQRTITDFTKHPERWIQKDFGINHRIDYYDASENLKEKWNHFELERLNASGHHDRKGVKVIKQPGNGSKSAFDFFDFDPDNFFGEAQQYCGLGGIEQNAFRLNKTHFWDNDFQRELAWVGAYLDWRAQHRGPEPTAHGTFWRRDEHDNFVEFNDHPDTTVETVVELMKEALVYLKKRDKENAKKRAQRAAAKVGA